MEGRRCGRGQCPRIAGSKVASVLPAGGRTSDAARSGGGHGYPSRAQGVLRGSGPPANLLCRIARRAAHIGLMLGRRNSFNKSSTRAASTIFVVMPRSPHWRSGDGTDNREFVVAAECYKRHLDLRYG